MDHFGLEQLKKDELKDALIKPFDDAVKAEKALNTKIDTIAKGTSQEAKAVNAARSEVTAAQADLRTAQRSRSVKKSELIDTAKTKVREKIDKFRDLISGKEVEVEISAGKGKKAVPTKVTASKALQDSFTKAETAATKVTGPASSHFGIVRTQKDGWSKAIKANGDKMKFWKEGLTGMERGKAFAHSGVVVGSAFAMGDALFRGKDSAGEDRSAAMRLAEFVGAGVVGSAALVGGRAIAR